jgi:type IV pilus assembly protein PilO
MSLRDPKTQKVLLVYFFLAGLAYMYFMSTFVPFSYPKRSALLTESRAKVSELEQQVQKAKMAIRDMDKLEREYAQLHSRWLLARELLPADKEVAALLRKVTVAGTRAGVEFIMFQPLGQVPQPDYTENPVQVGVVGSYHEVASFLSHIANLSRIVNVGELTINSYSHVDEPGKTAKAQFVATAYSLKKEDGAGGTTVQVGG